MVKPSSDNVFSGSVLMLVCCRQSCIVALPLCTDVQMQNTSSSVICGLNRPERNAALKVSGLFWTWKKSYKLVKMILLLIALHAYVTAGSSGMFSGKYDYKSSRVQQGKVNYTIHHQTAPGMH